MSLASYRAAPPRAISGSGCPGGPLYRITIFGPATRSRILSRRFSRSVVGHRPTTSWPHSERKFRRTPATPPPSHSSAPPPVPVADRSPHPHTRRYSGPRTRHPHALSRRRARHKASSGGRPASPSAKASPTAASSSLSCASSRNGSAEQVPGVATPISDRQIAHVSMPARPAPSPLSLLFSCPAL